MFVADESGCEVEFLAGHSYVGRYVPGECVRRRGGVVSD